MCTPLPAGGHGPVQPVVPVLFEPLDGVLGEAVLADALHERVDAGDDPVHEAAGVAGRAPRAPATRRRAACRSTPGRGERLAAAGEAGRDLGAVGEGRARQREHVDRPGRGLDHRRARAWWWSAATRGRRQLAAVARRARERRAAERRRRPGARGGVGGASRHSVDQPEVARSYPRGTPMDDKPRNLRAMLSEAKDLSELMVDLAYAALYFGDPTWPRRSTSSRTR